MSSDNIVKEGEAHFYIEGEVRRCFYGNVPSQLPVQMPSFPSAIIDEMFWNDFRPRLNPYILQINKGHALLSIIFPMVFIIWIIISPILFTENTSEGDSPPTAGASFLLVLIYFALIYNINKKNLRIDAEIKNIIENEYNRKLQSKGYSIEYRTQFTGFCKPKHAVTKRVIAFPKFEVTCNDIEKDAGVNQFTMNKTSEKNEPLNNDDVDRDKWGLNYEPTNNEGIDRDAWGLNY